MIHGRVVIKFPFHWRFVSSAIHDDGAVDVRVDVGALGSSHLSWELMGGWTVLWLRVEEGGTTLNGPPFFFFSLGIKLPEVRDTAEVTQDKKFGCRWQWRGKVNTWNSVPNNLALVVTVCLLRLPR